MSEELAAKEKLLYALSALVEEYEKENSPFLTDELVCIEAFQSGRFWKVGLSKTDTEGKFHADEEYAKETLRDRYVGKIVSSIVVDLQNRSGFENVWDALDNEIKSEIVFTWTKMLHTVLEGDLSPVNEEQSWTCTLLKTNEHHQGVGIIKED